MHPPHLCLKLSASHSEILRRVRLQSGLPWAMEMWRGQMPINLEMLQITSDSLLPENIGRPVGGWRGRM